MSQDCSSAPSRGPRAPGLHRVARSALGLLAFLGTVAPGLRAHAAEVRGAVLLPSELPRPATLGYTQARVTSPSAALRGARPEGIVFLRAQNTLPLPAPSARWKLKISGQRFEPRVLACAVDEQIEITNDDPRSLTLQVGPEKLEPLKAGGSLTYLCQQPGDRVLRIGEYPHASAQLFIGEVGLVGVLAPDGKFSVQAPPGTYVLEVHGVDGKLHEAPITATQGPVDLGRIDLTGPRDRAAGSPDAPAPGARPTPQATPPASPAPSGVPTPSGAPTPGGSAPPPRPPPAPRPRPSTSADPFELKP